jgi:uncharacterized protein (DUF58 family)
MTTLDLLSRRAEAAQPALEQTGRLVGTAVRPLRAATSIVSPVGWSVLLVCLLCFWAGGELGWAELRVVSIGCAAALIAAAAFTLGRSHYAVDLELQATRVVVGERAVGAVAVTNTSSRRLLPARIELPVGKASASFELPFLAAGEKHEDLFAIPTARRAVLVVGPVRSVRGDALGLLRRDVRWTDPVDLYVHPRTMRLEGSAAGFVRDLEGQPTRDLSSDDMAFHALRPYVPGDDRRHVHWKTSARTGTWMVRKYEQTRRSHLLVALSTASGDYAEPDEFELGVSAGASLALQALRDDKTLSVLTSQALLRIGSGRRLLDDLTEVETKARAPGLAELARRAVQEVLDATVVVLVCGSAPAPADMRKAASRFGQDVRVVIVRAATDEPVSRRNVGAATVITIHDLSDLPAMVRRSGTL